MYLCFTKLNLSNFRPRPLTGRVLSLCAVHGTQNKGRAYSPQDEEGAQDRSWDEINPTRQDPALGAESNSSLAGLPLDHPASDLNQNPEVWRQRCS